MTFRERTTNVILGALRMFVAGFYRKRLARAYRTAAYCKICCDPITTNHVASAGTLPLADEHSDY